MSPKSDPKLQTIAENSGGEYLKYTAADMEHLKGILNSCEYTSALKDSNNDGFSDIEEEKIGLVSSNGVRHFTDPDSADTDKDGLKENEEASVYFTTESSFSKIKKKYHTMTSYPDCEDSDGDEILDIDDSKPLVPYLCTGIWLTSDEKFSTTVQVELLKLELAWHLAVTDIDKEDIENRADEIRDILSSGEGKILDIAKSISGAAADEFAWFLGGDVSAAERDYWLIEVEKYNSSINISDEKIFHSIMFIAGILEPSPDDAWKLISKKAKKEMLEKCDKGVVKKFLKSMGKQATKEGSMGIKKLSGKGIKGFMYEVKVKGKGGAYRLLGNKTENGEIFWEVFEKTHK